MPGKQTKSSQLPPYIMICMLDCGELAALRGDPNSKEFGYSLTEKNWGYLEVSNPDFIKSYPTAGIRLNENEMLIFGGETQKTFILNTKTGVDQSTRKAQVTASSGTLDRKAKFGRADFVCHTYGQIFFALDAYDHVLHSHEMTNSTQWFSQSIADFGPPL